MRDFFILLLDGYHRNGELHALRRAESRRFQTLIEDIMQLMKVLHLAHLAAICQVSLIVNLVGGILRDIYDLASVDLDEFLRGVFREDARYISNQ
jgi:hypothetical protein